MSINIKDCEMNIRKDERGIYKTVTAQKNTNAETGEEETDFMNILVGFRKGIEIKNKTRIKINNAFLTHIKFETKDLDENGNPIIKRLPKIMIMDFEIIEDGIDENEKVRNYSNQKEENQSSNTFSPYDDDLPF